MKLSTKQLKELNHLTCKSPPVRNFRKAHDGHARYSVAVKARINQWVDGITEASFAQAIEARLPT